MVSYTRHAASFKDPSGFVFQADGILYRQVNQQYAAQYQRLLRSGLLEQLVEQQLLIPHQELVENLTQSDDWYLTLVPEKIPYISYSYEWSFEQLRDAGLLTLQILRTAISRDMILKDATPYNIQFHKGKPIFIDTLSFEQYDPSQPWVAYRQFCQCFLFPLYLEHYLRTGMQKIIGAYMDGIPVDLTAKLLPFKSRFNGGVWLHVLLQNTIAKSGRNTRTAAGFSRNKLLHLVSHLESILRGFPSGKPLKTTWSTYYGETILSKDYLQEKEKSFRALLQEVNAGTVLDLGANDGYFSKILAEGNRQVIATDIDHQCINNLYLHTKKNAIGHILPLVLDIASPSPAIGFHNKERASFHQRIQTELVVALALVHHLVIGRNIPLTDIAAYMNDIAPQLIIEFVDKGDVKVQEMLANRTDIFDTYTEAGFEAAFSGWFHIIRKAPLPHAQRTLYYMKRKN